MPRQRFSSELGPSAGGQEASPTQRHTRGVALVFQSVPLNRSITPLHRFERPGTIWLPRRDRARLGGLARGEQQARALADGLALLHRTQPSALEQASTQAPERRARVAESSRGIPIA